jgi:hypothetical protein
VTNASCSTPSASDRGISPRRPAVFARGVLSAGGLPLLKVTQRPRRRAATQTSPRNYPGSCSQRTPKRAKVTCVKSANLRRVVCGALALASNREGLIAHCAAVRNQPPRDRAKSRCYDDHGVSNPMLPWSNLSRKRVR